MAADTDSSELRTFSQRTICKKRARRRCGGCLFENSVAVRQSCGGAWRAVDDLRRDAVEE